MLQPGQGGASGEGMFLDPSEQGLKPEDFNPTGKATPASGASGLPSEAEPQGLPGQTKEEILEARRRYHQGRADSFRTKAEKLQEFVQGNEEAIALGKLVMQRPDMAQALMGALQVKPAAPELKSPEQPQRPDTFNRSEALSDPTSASAKYLEDLENYRDAKITYLEKLQSKRDAEYRRQLEEERGQREEQNRNSRVAQLLASDYGFNPNKIGKFFEMTKTPPQLEDMVAVLEAREAREARAAGNDPRTQRESREAPPPPVRMGYAREPGSVDQAAGLNLIQAARGKR